MVDDIDDDLDIDDEDFSEQEKSFVAIFQEGSTVFFLEESGSWWMNTFKDVSVAKSIVDGFKKV